MKTVSETPKFQTKTHSYEQAEWSSVLSRSEQRPVRPLFSLTKRRSNMPTTTTTPTATKTTASPQRAKGVKPQKPLPAPNSDFYYLYETLPAEELAVVQTRA